ncbi:MAG: hypothetical protein L0H84_02445 [Pseudonocardia sp.]|nr:hypothetical protein [Pseudonocardia sp.]
MNRLPRWESLGPDTISGAIRQLVIDPNDRRRLYAVSANGGLWCLDDVERYPGTSVWRPLTEQLMHLRFRTLAVAPGRPAVLYGANVVKRLYAQPSATVDVRSEIWWSRDRGSTWEPMHRDGLGVAHRLVVDPRNPFVLAAATSTGLWQRSLSGQWRQAFTRQCTDVAIDPADPDVVYVVTSSDASAPGVYRSTDGGQSWDRFIAAAAGDRHIGRVALGTREPDQTMQGVTTRTVVVRYGNKVRIRTPLAVDMEVSDANPATAADLADTLRGGSRNRSDLNPAIAQEWVNCLAVDPFDATRILVGGVGLFVVRAGRRNWRQLAWDPPHEDYHTVVFDPDVPNLVYVANDGGVFTSVDGGITWPQIGREHILAAETGRGRNLAKGLVTTEFRSAVLGGDRVVGAIDHTGLVLSDVPPRNWLPWSRQASGGTSGAHEGGLLRGCPVRDDRFYMCRAADRGGVRKTLLFETVVTTTGGTVDRVQPVEIPGPELHLHNTDFPDPMYFPDDQILLAQRPAPVAVRRLNNTGTRLFVFGAPPAGSADSDFRLRAFRLPRDGVTRLDGVAATISEVFAHPAAFVDMAFQPDDPDRLFALAADGTLVEARVDQLAATATTRSRWVFPAIDRFASRLVMARGQQVVLYAISQHALARWHVSGYWQTMTIWPDLEESLLCVAVHPSRADLLFVGTSRGVHVSEDGGASWSPFHRGLPSVPVTELAFSGATLRAATFGRGLWQCLPVGN